MKTVDRKALKILQRYSKVHPERTSKDDLAYAKAAGLCFEPISISHDEAIAWALKEFAVSDRRGVADAFLVGVGANQPHARAALSAHAVMTHFPDHPFQVSEYTYCPVCMIYRSEEVDLSFVNRCRWVGAVIGRQPYILAFYLLQHREDDFGKPGEGDIGRFCEVLDLIAASPENETPTSLYKKLRKLPGIKMSVEESRHFLEALGYAGILQNPAHPGFIYRYVGPSTPSKSHSSDWAYPIDFWTGKDGVNTDALRYWFSAYPEIANWSPA